MKIIMTTVLPNIESEVDPRFGRCAYFLEVDTDTLVCTAHPNPALDASGSAGVQAAQFVADRQVEAVISGDFGPNAYAALDAAGVAMYRYPARGTAHAVIERFNAGKLECLGAPTRAEGLHTGKG